MDGIENQHVGGKELAAILGVTPRWIRKLTSEGAFPKAARGKCRLADAMQSYVAYLRDKDKESPTSTDPADLQLEKTRLTHAQADKAELELQEYRGELHRAEDVEDTWTEMLSNFKQKILAIPTKLAPALQGIEDLNEIQKTLKRAHLEALQELSEYAPDAIAGKARAKGR